MKNSLVFSKFITIFVPDMEKLPKQIEVLISKGIMNRARRIDIPERQVYLLYALDSADNPIPTGLPQLVELTESETKYLQPKEVFEILEQYG